MLNRNRNQKPDEGGDGQPFFSRSFWIAAAVLAVVTLMAVGVLVARSVSERDSTQSGPPRPGPSQTSPAVSSSSSPVRSADCAAVTPSETGPSALPTTAPPTTWDQFGGGTLLSPTTAAGPYLRDSTSRRCFAQTRLGVMTAATNIAMATVAEPAIARNALEHQVTPGTARTEALQSLNSPAPAERAARVRGARILSYSADRAIAEVVLDLRQGGTSLLSIQSTMLWVGGDWKVDGANTVRPSAIEGLDGYIAWEAGR